MTENELYNELKQLHAELENKMDKLKPEIKNKISGNLRVCRRKSKFYYYYITKKGDTNGKYISQKNMPLAEQLARRDYTNAASNSLKCNINALQKFLHKFRPGSLDKAYTKLHPGKQKLIAPIQLPAQEYIQQWKAVQYKGKEFIADASEYYTYQGERVRSKSEIIIANLLAKYEIPYRYEFPLKIGATTFYPDFTCLNLRTRKEYLWEHFGMMDSPEYAENMVHKIEKYHQKGYIIGKKLIFTMETSKQPLSTKSVETIISEFLI